MSHKYLFCILVPLTLASGCVPVPPEQLDAARICHEASSEWEPVGGYSVLTLTVGSIGQGISLVEHGSCSLVSEEDFVINGTDESGNSHRYTVDIKTDFSALQFPVFRSGDVLTVLGSGVGDQADAIHFSSNEHTLIVQSRGPRRRYLDDLDVEEGNVVGRNWFSDCRTIEEVSALFSDAGENLELAPGEQGTLNGKSVVNFSSAKFGRSECFDSLPTGFIVSWAAWE